MFSPSKINDGIRMMDVESENKYLESILGGKVTPTFGVKYDVLMEMSSLYNVFRNINGPSSTPLSIPVKFSRLGTLDGFERNPVYTGLIQGFSGPDSPEYDDVFVPKNLVESYDIGEKLFIKATLPDVSSILLRPWR